MHVSTVCNITTSPRLSCQARYHKHPNELHITASSSTSSRAHRSEHIQLTMQGFVYISHPHLLEQYPNQNHPGLIWAGMFPQNTRACSRGTSCIRKNRRDNMARRLRCGSKCLSMSYAATAKGTLRRVSVSTPRRQKWETTIARPYGHSR